MTETVSSNDAALSLIPRSTSIQGEVQSNPQGSCTARVGKTITYLAMFSQALGALLLFISLLDEDFLSKGVNREIFWSIALAFVALPALVGKGELVSHFNKSGFEDPRLFYSNNCSGISENTKAILPDFCSQSSVPRLLTIYPSIILSSVTITTLFSSLAVFNFDESSDALRLFNKPWADNVANFFMADYDLTLPRIFADIFRYAPAVCSAIANIFCWPAVWNYGLSSTKKNLDIIRRLLSKVICCLRQDANDSISPPEIIKLFIVIMAHLGLFNFASLPALMISHFDIDLPYDEVRYPLLGFFSYLSMSQMAMSCGESCYKSYEKYFYDKNIMEKIKYILTAVFLFLGGAPNGYQQFVLNRENLRDGFGDYFMVFMSTLAPVFLEMDPMCTLLLGSKDGEMKPALMNL